MTDKDILIIRVRDYKKVDALAVKKAFPDREVWIFDDNVVSVFTLKEGYSPTVTKIFDLDEEPLPPSIITYEQQFPVYDSPSSGNSANKFKPMTVSKDQTTIWDYL